MVLTGMFEVARMLSRLCSFCFWKGMSWSDMKVPHGLRAKLKWVDDGIDRGVEQSGSSSGS